MPQNGVVESHSGTNPILLSILFMIVFTLLLLLYLRLSEFFELRTTLGFVPGPKTFPFIGLLWKISKVPFEKRFQWFNKLCFKYKNGMVVTWFGMEPMINIRRPEQIEVVLSTGRNSTKSSIYNIITPWLGDGLFTSSGDAWFDHRRLIKSTFKSVLLEEYFKVMQEKVEILVKCINSKTRAHPRLSINIFDLTVKCTLDTSCQMALGVDLDIQRNADNNLYLTGFQKFSKISVERNFRFWMKDSIFYATKRGKMLLNLKKRLHHVTTKFIVRKQMEREEKRLELKEDDNEPDEGKAKTFIDALIDTCERKQFPLTSQELREEIDTFIFKSYNPTSAAISWLLFSLGNAPAIQSVVHQELMKVFGDNDEPATINQLGKLEYLDRVIKEALRLYPSIPTISRSIDCDLVIDCLFIPRETTVNIQVYQLHHDPGVWEDPELFDPDRFLPENSNDRHPYAYLPFSLRSRECIAQKLALMQIKLTAVAILRKWRVLSALKPNEVTLVSNLILKPHDDRIDLYFTPINT